MSNTVVDTEAAGEECRPTPPTVPVGGSLAEPLTPEDPGDTAESAGAATATDPHTSGGRFAVLKHGQFRLVLIERLLSTSATGISTVALSFAVLAATRSAAHPEGSASALSFVLAAQLAPMLIFTLVGGVLADRFRPQRVMIAANVCAAVGEGVAALLVLTHAADVWSLLICAFLMGTGGALFYPASNALTPRLVPAEQMQAASSLSRLAQSSMLMLGSALGGVLVAVFGAGWAMGLDAGILLLGTLPMLRITVTALARPAEHAPSMFRELREGWAEVRSRTWLWAVIANYAVVLAAWFGGFMLTGPVVAKEHFGGAPAWATVISVESLGVLAGGLLALRFHPRRPMLAGTLLTFLFALPPLVMGLGAPLWAIVAAAPLAGGAGEFFMILWMVALSRHIPQDKLARVYSFDALGSLGASPAGYLVAGPLVNAWGARAVSLGAAGLITVATALTLTSAQLRTLRNDAPVVSAE